MKTCLKKFGLREIVGNPPVQSNEKKKFVAQKYAEKVYENTPPPKIYGSGWKVSIKEETKTQRRKQRLSPLKM